MTMAKRTPGPSWVASWRRQTDRAIERAELLWGRSLTEAERESFLPQELLRRLQAVDHAVAEGQAPEVVADLIRQVCEYDT